MSTITTWKELLEQRIGDGQITSHEDVRIAMLDHIDALTEALKVAQFEISVWESRAFKSSDNEKTLQADADRYRWLKNNCVLGIKQFGLGWSLSTRQGIAPDSLRDVDAAIDANRKGNV
tara:strand:- start:580 stop:936 length:357 start_codon:yes stop_codon:yes gene_type:complete